MLPWKGPNWTNAKTQTPGRIRFPISDFGFPDFADFGFRISDHWFRISVKSGWFTITVIPSYIIGIFNEFNNCFWKNQCRCDKRSYPTFIAAGGTEWLPSFPKDYGGSLYFLHLILKFFSLRSFLLYNYIKPL